MAEVLQLSDIVKITRLPAHTVRQWSVGRPYRIGASVRASSHRGVPKLFSPDDALRFAVVAQLTRDGLISRVIKAALDGFRAHAETLAITSGRVHWWNVVPFDVWGRAELEVEEKISVYVLNLARLRDELYRKIAARRENQE
jgi:hypothetical protein